MAELDTPVNVRKTTPAATAGRSLGQLRERWDRLFDDFFAGFPRWPALRRPFDIEPLRRLTGGDLIPAVGIKKQDQTCLITVELPGMDDKDVAVEVHDDLLTLHGQKRAQREEKDTGHHLTEGSYGSFARSFRLPPDADAGQASAGFAKGVLTVSAPRTAQAPSKVKKIDVKSA